MGVLHDVWISSRDFLKTLREQTVITEAFCAPPNVAEAYTAEEGDESATSIGLSQLDSAALELVEVPLKLSPQQTVLRDKLGFFLGITNLVYSTYWLGRSPETWCNWYTVKACVLFTIRIFLYRRRKWGFYLIEFCYYANVLLLLKIWIFPNSLLLHTIVFGLCAGPITFSIPALRNSLVLHSLDKTTSLFMHATPAVMAWCLRWHPYKAILSAPKEYPLIASYFITEEWTRGAAGLESISKYLRQVEDLGRAAWWFSMVGGVRELDQEPDPEIWQLILYPFIAYVLWAILYYIKVFVFSSDKILHQNYSNMYTLMVTNSKSGPAKLVLKAPKKLQPATYLLLHCVLCGLTISLAAVFWHHKTLHTTVLLACCASSAWNGATYFFDIFAHKYVEKVGVPSRAKKA